MTRPKKIEACPECDLLLNPLTSKPGVKAHCPRCGYLLQSHVEHSVERILALSLTGLILIVPTNILPIIGIRLFGNTQDGSLWSGVAALLREEMWFVAGLVFLSSILLPITNLVLAFLISVHLHFAKSNAYLAFWMRWFQHMNEWAMLEVYALGIIVACVKLSDMADIRFGFGLYTFIALLAVNTLLTNDLDVNFFWQRISQLTKPHETA